MGLGGMEVSVPWEWAGVAVPIADISAVIRKIDRKEVFMWID
jgi:hypothetical protein